MNIYRDFSIIKNMVNKKKRLETLNKKIIPIKGMHCKSCEVLISQELEALPGVASARVSLANGSAIIMAAKLPADSEIAKAVSAAGYEVGMETQPYVSTNKLIWRDFVIGAAVVAFLIFLFQALGIGTSSEVNTTGYAVGATALVVGLTAGFSTCMALIGGLVLGVAAKYAENHPYATTMQKFRPHMFFNLGRIIAFMLLGALIGMIGSAFQLKAGLVGTLMIAVGIVMLVLGLQLSQVFPRLKNVFTLPSGLVKKFGGRDTTNKEYSHKDAFLMGAATFFLPCGFTQAMQLMAVSTGNPAQSAIIMGAFAIGTTPGLLGIGGLTSIVNGAFAQQFFRIVGVVVIAMALLNIGNGLNLVGVGRWVERFVAPRTTTMVKPIPANANILRTSFTVGGDIADTSFTTKVGQPTVLEVDVKEDGQGCMSTIMITGLDDTPQYLKKGEKIRLSFTADRPGTYNIACAMGVNRGTITVEE